MPHKTIEAQSAGAVKVTIGHEDIFIRYPFLIPGSQQYGPVQSQGSEQRLSDTNKDEDIDGTLLLHKILQN